MAIIGTSIIGEFNKLTRFNLAQLLLDFSNFMDIHSRRIVDYYSGLTSTANRNSFRELDKLKQNFNSLNNIIENNKDRFQNTQYWELLESISDMQTTLETIENSSQWERSAIAKNNFSPGLEITHTLQMFQTLPMVSRVIVTSTNPQNEWVTIALRNDLVEEDYTTKGGNLLKLGFKNRASINIRSVIDTINGESVYGKDFPVKLQIDPDSEDMVVLSPKETVVQAVDILTSLKQGDSPEYPGEGISASVMVGGNRNSVSYPVLFRQLFNTFQKDDTLKSMRVVEVDLSQDVLRIGIEVETRLGEFFEAQT